MRRGGRFYNVVLNCSKLMLSLVNDLLDSSQIEAKVLSLNLDWFSVVDAIRECISILSFQAQGKNIDLESDIDDDLLSLRIYSD
jgi:signal transduction histidine kinase